MKIYFRVDRLRPDQRQYRQTELELVPDNPLVVAVEIGEKYLDDVADNVITLEGLKAIVQACDLVFMGTSVSPQNDEFEEEVELNFD